MTITQPEDIDQPSMDFANRVTGLVTQNPWMDVQTATALSQQPTPDEQLPQQANTVGDSLAQTWDGYEQQFFDPTLQAQPSTAQAVADYLHATLGPPATSSGSITQLQTALNKDGYLPSSAVNGVWDSSSEAAYNQAVNTYKSDVLAGGGRRPLTSKVSGLVHSLFHDATHPWDAVSGWYDSVRQAVGDLGGGLSSVIVQPFADASGKQLLNQYSANIINTLGGKATPQSQAKVLSNPLNALGDLISVGGASSVARGAVKGVAEQGFKGAAKGAAAESTDEHLANITQMEKIGAALGTAKKLGFTGSSINDITDALRAGTLPSTDPAVQRAGLGIVTKTLLKAPGTVLKGPDALVSARWAQAVPGLARLAPVTEPLAAFGDKAASGLSGGGDALAYKVKNLMAQPYRLAPVRAAGIAYQRGAIGSLTSHAVANALPGSTLQKNIDRQNHGILDSLADAQIVPGLHLTAADLAGGGLLHGDLIGDGKASNVVGRMVTGYTNGLADRMGSLGGPAAFQTALGLSRQDLLNLAGGDSGKLLGWMDNQVDQYASDLYAQREVSANFTGGKADEVDALQAAREQWYQLPTAERTQWVTDVTSRDPHLQGLQTRIKAGLLRNTVDPKAAVRSSMAQYFDDTGKLQDFVAQGGAHYVLTPGGQPVLGDESEGELAQLTAHDEGAIGMQNTEIKTRSEMNQDADTFAQGLYQAKAGAETTAITKAMIDYLHVEANMDASRLGVFDQRNPDALVAQIRKEADRRAEEVLPTWDAPKFVTDHIADLKASGKRIVVGSHIGHVYDGTLPSYATMDGFKTPIRKWAGKVGLDPQRIPDVEVGKAVSQSKDAGIHQFLTTDPDARLATPYGDFRTARVALEAATGKNEMNPILSAALSLTSKFGLNKTAIDNIVKEAGVQADGNPLPRDVAEGQLKAAIGSQFGIRDLAKKKLVDHLMTTQEIQGPAGAFTWHGVDRHTATGIVNAAVRAYRQPGYMMGLEQIENFARSATYGIGDKLVAKAPDSPLYNLVNAWPNKILNARNQLRFTVSPLFAARVATKVRYKAALEGVRIPFNPLASLIKTGDDKAAQNLLSRMGGKLPTEQMDADRYAVSRDVFGIHDSQWDAAYFVHAQQAKGLTPNEVQSSYERVFKYGTEGGRSALERTANTLFFPFSFEKTLLRNTGAFLLDHPTQALVLDNAVEQWRKLDNNARVGKFIDAHFPALQELQLLNGFSHGISPGQFGGINAPILGAALKAGSTAAAAASSGKSEALLNLLMPQAWGSNFTKKNLETYMPIWKQAGQLFKSVGDQADITGAAWHDTWSKVVGSNAKPEPTLAPYAQITDALAKKATLVNDPAIASIVSFNDAQNDDASKYTWPTNTALPQTIWGQPVDKTTISEYVQYLYPAYNPQDSADYAVGSKQQEQLFIQNVAKTDPQKAAQLSAFSQLADKVISHLNDDSYDTPTAKQVQGEFHDAAQSAAMTDPTWLKFYSTFYKSALGPIVSPNGKAAA